MNIDLVLENLSFDLRDTLVEDPTEMFYECMIDTSDIYTEAQEGVNKKNFLHKLWNFIKKIFGLIRKAVSKSIEWIRKLFNRKTKSADQIAEDLGIRSNKVDHKDIAKKLSVRFNEDNSFSIKVRDTFDPKRHSSAAVKGQSIYNPRYINSTIYQLKHPNVIKLWINLFERIVDGQNVEPIEIHKLNDLLERLSNSNGSLTDEEATIKYEELSEFQNVVTKLDQLVEKYDAVNFSVDSFDDNTIIAMNRIASETLILQMGLNGISLGLQHIYQIDQDYFGSINDPEQLSKFVEELISSDIPSKYVINNIYNICDISLKGKDSNPDKPVAGQSRVVLFPTDKKIVYKVAINQMGIRSNKNEAEVTKVYSGTNLESKIARVVKVYGFIVNAMERATPEDVDFGQSQDFKYDIEKLSIDNKLPFTITDVNPKGFGRDKWGKLVLLDYGFLDRISRK